MPERSHCIRCKIEVPLYRRAYDDFYSLCGACIQDLRGLDALDGQEPHTGRHLSSDVTLWIWED